MSKEIVAPPDPSVNSTPTEKTTKKERVLALHREGLTQAQIAKALLLNRGNVFRILKATGNNKVATVALLPTQKVATVALLPTQSRQEGNNKRPGITAEELAHEMKLYTGELEAQGLGLGWLSGCPTCPSGTGLSLAFNQLGSDLVLKCYGGCSDEALLRAVGGVPGFKGLTAHQWVKQEIQRGCSPNQAHETVSRLLVPPRALRHHNTTDLGNSERFVSLHGERIRFSRSLGWMVWTGKRWAQDATGEVSRLAVDAVRNIYREAADAGDEKERKALAKHAMHSEAKGRIKATIELAEFAEEVACHGDEFDQRPWLFNCFNGIIDLQTGELSSHQPSQLLTQFSPVCYEPTARCPGWERYLLEVMKGKQDLVSFLQRAVGYTLTGDTGEQKFFLLWGTGRNGKGVFMNVLLHLLGGIVKCCGSKEIKRRPVSEASWLHLFY